MKRKLSLVTLAVLGALMLAVLSGVPSHNAAHAQASPSVAIDLSSTSVEEGTAIAVTMSFGNLAEDADRATTDYLFRADVVDADGCEDQAGGYGLGVDRKINQVDEDPEVRRGTISADCPAGDYTVRASISDSGGGELASATAGFSVVAPEPPASSDAALSSLALSGVTLEFDPATTTYAAQVGNDVAETTVTPTVNDDGATYAVRLDGAADEDGIVPLAVGGNAITVVVTAEDGDTTKTYTVTVTRAEPPASGPTVAIALSPSDTMIEGEGTEIAVTLSFGNLTFDDDRATTDYIFRADVKDSENGDADECEDQAGGYGLGVDRKINLVDEDPEVRRGAISADCPAGVYTLRASISNADNEELASAAAEFFVLPPLTAVEVEEPEQEEPRVARQVAELGFDLDSANAEPKGIWSNGTTIWVVDSMDRKLYAYTLADGGRDNAKDISLNSDNGNPTGLWSDGTTIWVADGGSDRKLYAYTLDGGARDTNKDLDLANGSPSGSNNNATARGIWSDGTTIWVADDPDRKVYAYTLNSGLRNTGKEFSLATGTPSNTNNNSDAVGMWSDGTTIWVGDYNDDKLYAYTLNGGGRDSGKDVSVSSAYSIWGIWSDGDTVWVLDQVGDYVHDYALPKTPTDATLSGLTLSAGTLDPTFAGATEEYAASVNNEVASVTVTAAATDTNATVAITYGSDATVATGGVVPLSVGPNSITVTVTPVVGTAKTYTLTVTRRAPASLTVVWTPQSGNSQQYEVSWTDPVACPSGTNYYAYALLTGDISIHFDIGNVASTVFTVTGTPTVLGVGVASMHTVEVYCGIQGQPTSRLVASVELTGTTGGTFRFPANDATLSALTLSGVTLAFDPATLSYTVSVGNDVAETTVTPTPNHAEASYAIKLNGAADADGVIPLAVGGNVITVVVTAEDGETSRTYTVTITREESLATLTVVGTQPDPNITRYTFAISWVDGFSCASGTNYYAYFHLFYKHNSATGWRDLENVASSANTMSVTHTDVSFNPELRHPNIDASLVLYCGERDSGREVGRVDVTDAVGTFIFPSTDSTLSALSVGGVPAPGFAPATTEYSMTVDNNVASTTVTPTLNHATASFEVTPEDADPDTDGHQVDLAVGANVITAVVTAQDDSTTTYTVTVTRVPSTDASLRRLTFSGIADFQFVPGTLTYNVTPVVNLQSTTVAAATTHAGASYVVKLGGVEDADRVIELAYGENVITVVVTAQDKMATRTYTVTVDNPAFIPGALPVIASLDGQDVGGPFTVRFTFLKAANRVEAMPVTGFALGDIGVTNGVASDLVKAHGTDAYDRAIWEATITPDTYGTPVVVSLAADVVPEGNQAASLSVTTRVDDEAPTVTLRANVVYFESGEQSSVITRPTGLHIKFNERVKGLEIGDFEVTNGEIGYLNVDADGNGHAVLVPKMSESSHITVRLKANAVHDLANNKNAAAQVVLHASPDDTPPEIVGMTQRLSRVDDDGTHVWALTFVFSEPVKGFGADDVVIISGNGTKSTESRANHEYGTRWAMDIESDGGQTPITVSVAAGRFSDGNNNNTEAFSGEIDRSVPPPASDD